MNDYNYEDIELYVKIVLGDDHIMLEQIERLVAAAWQRGERSGFQKARDAIDSVVARNNYRPLTQK